MVRGTLQITICLVLLLPVIAFAADELLAPPVPTPIEAEVDAASVMTAPTMAEPLLVPRAGRDDCLPSPNHLNYGGCNCPQHPCWRYHGYPWYCRPSWKAREQEKCWGYPEEFCERPFGAAVKTALDNQIANGLRDQQTLYEYDFSGARLSYRGQYQLQKIARRMQSLVGPVWIEARQNSELNQKRQLAVIEGLNQLGIPADQDLVQIQQMIRPGLIGVEAIEIFNNQLQQTQDMGGMMMGTGSSSMTPTAIPTGGQ